MLYGYINSTELEQEEIYQKIRTLEESKGIIKNNIFIDYDNVKKPKFNELVNQIQKFDCLIILDITDISTIEQLCSLIEISVQKKIKLVLETLTIDCTKQDNLKVQGMIEMAFTISTFRKKTRQNFIKKGVNKAKDEGKKLGRPRLTIETLPEIVKEIYPLYESGTIGVTEFAKKCDMSRPRVVNYIKFIEAEKENGNYEGI